MKKYISGLAIAIVAILISYLASYAVNSDPEVIKVLMPAPFADSTSNLIETYNQENKGKVYVEVTRGPLETEAVSDLAISSLILGKSPFDIILMDVTWLPKYAEADWLLPLDEWFNDENVNKLAFGAKLGNYYKN